MKPYPSRHRMSQYRATRMTGTAPEHVTHIAWEYRNLYQDEALCGVVIFVGTKPVSLQDTTCTECMYIMRELVRMAKEYEHVTQ